MIKRFRAVGFILAAFGLFACNQAEKTVSPERRAEGKGSAHVRLPSVPADFLAKTGAGSKAQALFALTIYGHDMAPIHQSWILTPGQPQSAYVGDIPVGHRIFSGRLIRLDSGFGDTTITHEGTDSVYIVRDSITDVNLFLRKAAGGGTAHICVEVEGWPTDSTCIKPPIPVPSFPWFGGCWNLSITKPGATPRFDTVFKAKLRIEQWDSTVMAYVTWNSGATDSAYGYVTNFGGLYIGYNGGPFTLKAYRDTFVVDTTGAFELQGEFSSKPRNIWGHTTGSRAPCGIVIPPVEDSTVACWTVWQSLINGASHRGTLRLHETASGVWGHFRWAGYPDMYVSSTFAPSTGSTLYLYGDLPRGMTSVPDGVTHRAHYKAKIGPGTLDAGILYKRWVPGDFEQGDLFGKWGGTPTPCRDTVRTQIIFN